LPLGVLKNKIHDLFYIYKIKIISEDSTEIRAKQGSQFQSRGLGTSFVNAKRLPKRISIFINKNDIDYKIEVEMEESLGLGLMTSGMKRKYMIYFKMLMEIFKRGTQELMPEETPVSPLNKLNYCVYCGNKIIRQEQKFCGNCGKNLDLSY
ncbi:hypothetical protein LCGC14_1392010, partial [marine sediment metagenome]